MTETRYPAARTTEWPNETRSDRTHRYDPDAGCHLPESLPAGRSKQHEVAADEETEECRERRERQQPELASAEPAELQREIQNPGADCSQNAAVGDAGKQPPGESGDIGIDLTVGLIGNLPRVELGLGKPRDVTDRRHFRFERIEVEYRLLGLPARTARQRTGFREPTAAGAVPLVTTRAGCRRRSGDP